MTNGSNLKIPESALSVTTELREEYQQRLAEEFGADALKGFKRLLGNPMARSMNKERNFLLSVIHAKPIDIDDYRTALDLLRNINKRTAFRLLAHLPNPLSRHFPSDLTEFEFAKDHEYWAGVGMWLLRRELEESSAQPILESCFAPYYLRAELASKRFDLIQALIEYGAIPAKQFPRAGVLWLLAEVAQARQRISKLDEHFSRKDAYKQQVEYIRSLNYSGDPFLQKQAKGLEERLFYFDQIIDTIARQLAEKNSEFENLYFKPYTSAMTTWNRARKKSNFQPIRKDFSRDRTG